MHTHRLKRLIFALATIPALLIASLACNESNMRTRDLPEWSCPTDIPPPTHTMVPTATVLPGTATPNPLPTFTPWPTSTPYVLTNDFPLGKHVKIGGVGGVGFGIWVWMDNTQVDGPYLVTDSDTGEETTRWIASWDITVENASFTRQYEFYPFAQIYALEIKTASDNYLKGAWPISAEAHDQIGIPELELSEETTVLDPGEQITIRVASYIPGPELIRMAYVLDPLDTENIEEMIANNSLGSNVGVWINEYEQHCNNGEITPPYQPGTPVAPGTPIPGTELLARLPVNGVYITRGFGCHAQWTGELGTGCPASKPWFHNGVDFAHITGSPYIDPLRTTGSVSFAGADDAPDCSSTTGSLPPHNGYGNFVRSTTVTDGHEIIIWGGHLSAYFVQTGDITVPGMQLGAIGSTGCSTGPHLHFAVKVDGRYRDACQLAPGGC